MHDLKGAKPRAYTSVMSLMNTMAIKGQLLREPRGKAFIYTAAAPRETTLGQMVADLVHRAFRGSTGALVAHLLTETSTSELDEIQRTIAAYKRKRGRS
jgi:predicted transcriptional regulator